MFAGRLKFRAESPVYCGAVIMLAGGILLILNLGLGVLDHGRTMKLSPQLIGVVLPPVPVPPVPRNLLDGSFQAAFASQIGAREPYFPAAVRLRNQVEYSLLGMSPNPSIIIGRHGQLLETPYVQDYCTRDVAAFLRKAPEWAAAIRRMQDAAAKRGVLFLYLLTPSKVAQYPQYLPAGLRCSSSQADRLDLVPAWAALVRQAGIHFIDMPEILDAAKPNYPFALFPQGGTHWNAVASALAAQAIQARINALAPALATPPFAFNWHMIRPVEGTTDMDLAMLMNLMVVPNHYAVPALDFTQAPQAKACRTARMVMIGGSFLGGIAQTFSNLPCAPQTIGYWYWTADRNTWTHGQFAFTPVVPAQRDADLKAANVILYEENEQLLGRARQGPLLYQWLLGRAP